MKSGNLTFSGTVLLFYNQKKKEVNVLEKLMTNLYQTFVLDNNYMFYASGAGVLRPAHGKNMIIFVKKFFHGHAA